MIESYANRLLNHSNRLLNHSNRFSRLRALFQTSQDKDSSSGFPFSLKNLFIYLSPSRSVCGAEDIIYFPVVALHSVGNKQISQ